MAIKLTERDLRRIFPHARDEYIKAFLNGEDAFKEAGMLDENVWPMVMGNVGQECGGCSIIFENMSYSARRMREVWPSRFRGPQGIAKSKWLAHNPRRLANQVYGARLGNRGRKTDDGYNFRGTGPLQSTGRRMALKMQAATGVPFADDPSQLAAPENWPTMIIFTWTEYHGDLNRYAKQGGLANFRKVCNGINRGNPNSRYNPIGWDGRKRYYNKALRIWGSEAEDIAHVLRDGDRGPEVRAMQDRLRQLGYHLGAADGVFGDATEQALELFQKTNGLTKDGVYGPLTRKALYAEDAIGAPLDESRANAKDVEGSKTIEAGNVIQAVGTCTAVGGVAKGVSESGAMQTLAELGTKAASFETAGKAISGAANFAMSNLWLVAAIAAALGLYLVGRRINMTRLKDHVTGANMGR